MIFQEGMTFKTSTFVIINFVTTKILKTKTSFLDNGVFLTWVKINAKVLYYNKTCVEI